MNASADSAGPGYDVFVSYAHADCAAVGALVAALRAGGLKVWFDESEIPAFAAIAQRIAQGLAQSKAFLAYYSKTYPTRRGCQYELMTAFVAAQAATRGLERLLVVNPESSDVHIQPINLHNTKYLSGPTTSEALTAGSAAISAHLSTLVGSFGPPAALTPPQWYPSRGIGSTRFVGRVEQMWEIHSRLNDDTAPFAASRDTAGVAQITGLGGVGKSLLAEEYALRFGAAYPGGIYWLRALGSDATGESSLARLEAARIDQYSVIGAQLQLLPGNSPADLEGQLRYHFQNRGKRGLWVVDDMPAGLPVDTLRSWFAPHPLLKTLFTTRSREYTAIAAEVALGVLPEDDAYALLTSRVKSSGAAEESAARATIQALGAHALALDVAAAALTNYEGTTSFQDFARELEIPDADSLELAANLADTLPNGHEKSIATTLLGAIRSASEPARDVLRLASLLAAAPIPEPLLIVIPAGPRGQSGPQGGWSEADASMKFRLAVMTCNVTRSLTDRKLASGWSTRSLRVSCATSLGESRAPRLSALPR